MIVYRFDEDGLYKEPVEIKDGDPIPTDCTADILPEINYRPRFVDGEWVETLSQKEIDQLLITSEPKSDFQILKETVDQLVLYNLTGGI